jgi:alanine racemase
LVIKPLSSKQEHILNSTGAFLRGRDITPGVRHTIVAYGISSTLAVAHNLNSLEPANNQMKPVYTATNNVRILGGVLAAIRRMS